MSAPPETERPSSFHRERRGRPQGMSSPPETEPHPSHHPPPPLRGRGTFSPKTLPVRSLHRSFSAHRFGLSRLFEMYWSQELLKCIGLKSYTTTSMGSPSICIT